jgi:hypothetical protein
MIAFQNQWNQHATPGFGSKYIDTHSDALSNVTQSVFGTTVYPAFRLEHSFKRNDPMTESPPRDEPPMVEDEDVALTPRTENYEGFTIPLPHDPQVNDYTAPFGSGFDRTAPAPIPPPPAAAAAAEEDEYLGYTRVPRPDVGPYPPGSYPAYKNDAGTTIEYYTRIALDHPPEISVVDTIDITDKLESTFVTEMISSQIESIIHNTLNVRRSFVRGSWTVSIDIDALRAELGHGVRVLKMPNGWIYVRYIDMVDFNDARHSIGGGGGTSSTIKSRIKPPVVKSIPNSVFSNVYVSDIYSLQPIKPSKLAEYIEMENKFKRIAKRMRGGRKYKKSKRNKKTKKRSKKQTRKRN